MLYDFIFFICYLHCVSLCIEILCGSSLCVHEGACVCVCVSMLLSLHLPILFFFLPLLSYSPSHPLLVSPFSLSRSFTFSTLSPVPLSLPPSPSAPPHPHFPLLPSILYFSLLSDFLTPFTNILLVHHHYYLLAMCYTYEAYSSSYLYLYSN